MPLCSRAKSEERNAVCSTTDRPIAELFRIPCYVFEALPHGLSTATTAAGRGGGGLCSGSIERARGGGAAGGGDGGVGVGV
jgi:hypothetical protein